MVLLLLAGIGGARIASGQSVADTTTPAVDALTAPSDGPRVTLGGWAAARRVDLLDQSHAVGDRFYDRGVFRHITPGMDREYTLDRATYRYTPGMDRVWRRHDSGLRLRMGSITRTQLGTVTQIKHTGRLAENHALRIDAVLQEDFRATRAFLEVGYAWAITPVHRVGVRHTFGRFKADLDASAFYQYGTRRKGRARLSVTAMDAYNDLLYDVLGVWRGRRPFTRSYRQNPFLVQAALTTPQRYRLWGEVHLGWQRPSVQVMQSQFDDAVRYRDRETAHYATALLAYDAGPVTTGLAYQRDYSSLDRLGLRPGVTSDYRTEQRFHRGGAFVTGRWRFLRGSAWLFRGRYYDRQTGTDFARSTIDQAVDWTEGRTNLQVRLYYVPPGTGLFAGLEYISLDRDPKNPLGVMKEQWATGWAGRGLTHYRGPVILGYRFGEGAVSLGVNYDYDGDRKGDRFDNGFFRFVYTW